jgi:hypothetical protein
VLLVRDHLSVLLRLLSIGLDAGIVQLVASSFRLRGGRSWLLFGGLVLGGLLFSGLDWLLSSGLRGLLVGGFRGLLFGGLGGLLFGGLGGLLFGGFGWLLSSGFRGLLICSLG